MSIWVVILVVAGAAAFTLGGYLLGVKRGRQARERLRWELGELAQAAGDGEGLREELETLRQALDERQSEGEQGRLLAGLLAREQVGVRLAQLDASAGLDPLIEGIAEEGGFPEVVLCDDDGLPLAANPDCRRPEVLAGVSSLVFILVDRVPRHGLDDPVAVKLHTGSGTMAMFRKFTVGERRYVLVVMTDDAVLSPAAFDSTISKLKRLLTAKK